MSSCQRSSGNSSRFSARYYREGLGEASPMRRRLESSRSRRLLCALSLGCGARDRWVIFASFSVLIVATLSEISIPHYLTASIFTAQSCKVAVFRQNVRDLESSSFETTTSIIMSRLPSFL
ncbi:hypothetical protein TB2_007233 [Malus domestica]